MPAASSTKFFIARWQASPSNLIQPSRSTTNRRRRKLIKLCIAANFAEVFLAREGHSNPIGINFLEKVQLPHLASIYGAMLAGVGYVLMGAGIPSQIPGLLDAFAAHRPAEYRLSVTGAVPGETQDPTVHFDPADYAGATLPSLTRPTFLAIVSSHTLARAFSAAPPAASTASSSKAPPAGGHNAPPRGKLQLNEAGRPLYGQPAITSTWKKMRAPSACPSGSHRGRMQRF